MDLTKEADEMLESRLSEKSFLDPGTGLSSYRHCEKGLIPFFLMDDDFVYSGDAEDLLGAVGCEHDPGCSRASLLSYCTKAVTLHPCQLFILSS